MKTKCGAETTSGNPCSTEFGLCDQCGLCFQHCDHRAEERAAAKRKAGHATAKKYKAAGLKPDELPSLESLEAAQEWLEIIGRAVTTGRLTDKAARAAIQAVREWVQAEGARFTNEQLEAVQQRLEAVEGDGKARPGLGVVR